MLEKRVKLRLVFFLSRKLAFHEKYKVKGVFWNVSKRCWCRERRRRHCRCRRRRRQRRRPCRRWSRRQNISFSAFNLAFNIKWKLDDVWRKLTDFWLTGTRTSIPLNDPKSWHWCQLTYRRNWRPSVRIPPEITMPDFEAMECNLVY